ncbi:hypothetical protein BLA23254_05998 [Burkholderia lata]|uniref:Uncharacterized protein n=1 Tax=Burkholderia lata (strain ATCC 17760 / DSM 23089 / LMG 22485 / NCIMB 9086 / R18194 / 383) TaxID=482957 RepID=A0A6P2QQP0_BURL3|nr:hypothetical protein BLA23254_05998 [Burkholderia lata]
MPTGEDVHRARSRIGCARRCVVDQCHDGVRVGHCIGRGVRCRVLCDGIGAAARERGCGEQGCAIAPSRRTERLFRLEHHGLPMRAMPRRRAAIYVWCRGPVKVRSPVGSRSLSGGRWTPAAIAERHAGPPCESLSARFVPPAASARRARRKRSRDGACNVFGGRFVSGMKRLSYVQRAGASAARCQRWNRIDAIQQTRNIATMP